MILILFVIATKEIRFPSIFHVGGTNKKATRGENHDDILMS